MKLAECLLQERPIKRDGMTHWYKPVIKSEMCANALCGSQLMGLESLVGETMFFLNAKDFAHNDWEVKQEPLKVEFECKWEHSPEDDFFYPKINISDCSDLLKLEKSGKRFRVTCVEVVE